MKKSIFAVIFLAALVTVSIACSSSIPDDNFAHVKGGSFQMGDDYSGAANKNERPAHRVTLSSFYMSKYPVTQKEWAAVMGSNPSRFGGENRPVENVNWFDAVQYCNNRSLQDGLTPAYTINGENVTWNREANGYRLPTEAEWEYAAKGGDGSPGNFKFSGSNDPNEVAWHKDNSGGSTRDVGTKKPNGLGLYDMSGNIAEWCWDWFGDYRAEAQTDPLGAFSSVRVGRGGSWRDDAQESRSAFRSYSNPHSRYGNVGFRIASRDKIYVKTSAKAETKEQGPSFFDKIKSIFSSGDSPSAVVRKLYTALEKRDLKAINELMTSESAGLMTLAIGMEMSKGNTGKEEFGIIKTEETINGDTAVVNVTSKDGGTSEWDLVKVDGKWKVILKK
ncbi:MAG: SUMF1/EgtB/PvdO family nonheme iron enzyme [Leptospirales bacterium]|nr:SUMF1/EgtB/PvdO family nonheme iron enzyme [Leptospirales bacterium]